MPIFARKDDALTMLNILPAGKEKELQRLIEKNLPEALEMHFIASEYQTLNGRIDTLAIDMEGCPVIIEYKRSKNDNVINQSLSYLKWLQAQRKEFFEMLMQKQLSAELLATIKLDWKNPRIICVAESFSKFDADTVEVVPLRIELFKYRFYENGLFSLEMLGVNEKNTAQVMPIETTQGIIQAMQDQNETSHLISVIFDELREMILGIDEFIDEKPGRRTISYKLTKKFAEILIRKDRLVIDLRSLDYVDPKGMVEKIAKDYMVTLNRRITLNDPRDVEYVFGIVQQSYQNVL